MSRHATAEDLSAYVDEELEPVRLRLVESHLEECEECRGRVEGLRGLVGDLRRLERLHPPPALEQYLERHIALTPRPRGWIEGVEDRLRGLALQSNLGFTFAMVFAFAVILYLFAGWSERQHRSGVQILRPTPPGVRLTSPVMLGDREFQRLEGAWWESGVAPGSAAEAVDASSDQGELVRASLPGLDRLLAEGSVTLRYEGRVLRVRIGSSPAEAPADTKSQQRDR